MEEKPINECPVPTGILVIIGGKENKGEEATTEVQKENSEPLEVLHSFIDLIRKDNPRIAVITSASELGKESFDDYRKAFKELNVENLNHIHHDTRAEAMSDEGNELLKTADAIFFSGGDQLKLTSVYGGTDMLLNLKQRYIHEHLVIAGTSAGAMALSTPMIYAGNQDVQQISGEIKITTGLEFLKDVCIDTHFVDRGRFVRMAQVVASNPTCVGIGVEEDTALIVRNGIEAEIAGSGIVIITEGKDITGSNITDFSHGKAISIRDLKVHLLSKGDKFTIPQRNPPHI